MSPPSQRLCDDVQQALLQSEDRDPWDRQYQTHDQHAAVTEPPGGTAPGPRPHESTPRVCHDWPVGLAHLRESLSPSPKDIACLFAAMPNLSEVFLCDWNDRAPKLLLSAESGRRAERCNPPQKPRKLGALSSSPMSCAWRIPACTQRGTSAAWICPPCA